VTTPLVCSICDTNNYWVTSGQSCVCPTNAVAVGVACQCKGGYTSTYNNGVLSCGSCPYG